MRTTFFIASILPLLLFLVNHANAVTPSEGLIKAAKVRTQQQVTYDGAYVRLDYPNGDVADSTGVCTDLIIRSYRAIGLDLQVLVHEDMLAHFALYPSHRIWGLKKPDANIDHRRVPNLRAFFSRHGQSLGMSDKPDAYLAGDMVTWTLPGNLPHIGIISDVKSAQGVPLVIHNIGGGPVQEDALFRYNISGHYRFYPDNAL